MSTDETRTPFGSRLFAARKEAGLNQTELAKKVGMSQSSIAEAEKSGQGSPSVVQLAFALGVNPMWLETGKGPKIPAPAASAPQTFPISDRNVKKIWAVGKASGGMPERIWTDNNYPVGELYEFAEEASSDPNAFLVEIDNISMQDRYEPGEFALVEPSTPVQAGDDVMIRLASGETMIKRLDLAHNGYRLRSLNGGEQFFFPPEQVSWVYYVAHPVPRRRIKTRH